MSTVGQLMTTALSVIGEDATIHDAAHRMHVERIGSLLVKVGDAYTGILTETDVVRAVAERKDLTQLMVKHLMSSPIITIEAHLSAQYARDMMADRRIRHLAVTEDGVIAGVISVRDLLAYFKTVTQPPEM